MRVLDFRRMRITIVVTPFDMRAGYRMLSSSAKALFDIDVDAGRDAVVFVSKSMEMCKVVWADDSGTSMLTRKLRRARFERFLVRVNAQATQVFTAADLNCFLDGVRIMHRPTGVSR